MNVIEYSIKGNVSANPGTDLSPEFSEYLVKFHSIYDYGSAPGPFSYSYI